MADEGAGPPPEVAQILQWPDPTLRSRAREVPEERFDRVLVDQGARLIHIMRAARGQGLAAPQVGVLQRAFAYVTGEDAESPAAVIVNPVVEETSAERATELEGCLSIRGVLVEVERPVEIVMTGRDVHGDVVRLEAGGALARRLQHELDHLDGVLTLQRTSAAQRKAAVRALRDGESMIDEDGILHLGEDGTRDLTVDPDEPEPDAEP